MKVKVETWISRREIVRERLIKDTEVEVGVWERENSLKRKKEIIKR